MADALEDLAKPEDIVAKDADGFSLLHHASLHGSEKAVHGLLKAKAAAEVTLRFSRNFGI